MDGEIWFLYAKLQRSRSNRLKIGSFHKMAGILSGPRALFNKWFSTGVNPLIVNSLVGILDFRQCINSGKCSWFP